MIAGVGMWSALAPEVLADNPHELLLGTFTSQTDVRLWQAGGSHVAITVEPRTPQDANYKLKVLNGEGNYPGFALPKPPADWSSYAEFSFEIWSPVAVSMELRIDDVSSRGYSTRFNYSFKVTKGRNLVQVPIDKIRRSVNVSQIKFVELFMVRSTPGLTLYYDRFRLGPMEKEIVDFIPYAERNDTQPTLEIQTPHFEFGRNLSGGAITTFAIESIAQGRGIAELMQRLDTRMSVVSWDREGDVNAWGLGNCYQERGAPDDQSVIQRYLASSMQGPEKFAAMLMTTPMGWNVFPQGARERIISRVEQDGAGLILVMPFPGGENAPAEWSDELRKICALIDSPSDYLNWGHVSTRPAKTGIIPSKKWRVVGTHPITSGVPLEALPTVSYDSTIMDYKVAPGAQVLIETEDGHPVMAVKQVGKGRVVTFAFRAGCLSPPLRVDADDRMQKYPYRYWEIWYDLLARSTFWAAGRTFQREGVPVPLAVQGENTDPCLQVRQWKDAAGKVTDWQLDFTPPPAIDVVRLSAPEMIDRGKDLVVEIPIWKCKDYGSVKWRLTAAEPSISDERILESIDMDLTGAHAPTKDHSCIVSLPTRRLSKTAALLHLTGTREGKLVAEGRATVLFTPDQTWDDFEIHCWGGSQGLPYLLDVERRLEKQLGVTCQQTSEPHGMGDALANGFRNQFYAGISGLHVDIGGIVQDYTRTKDPKLLVRKPSFADPEELARRHKEVLDRFSRLGKFKPLSGIIADETSLTSYTAEFDFDFHPANIAAFRSKLEARFKDVTAMNEALKTKATSFAGVMPPTTAEAKASGNWGLWNEWRAHNDDMWTQAMLDYATWFDEACPGMRFSASGTQVSTPFNGIDWAKMTKAFGSIVGYRGRYQDLQRLCFHPAGDFKTMSWVGYKGKGLAAHHQVWENLLSGDSGCGVFWWFSMRNPDLSWSESAKAYKAVFDVFRGGLGRQFQLARRDFSPVAVLWSANSQRAAFTVGRFNEFVAAETEVISTLRASGFDPYFISEEQLVAGELISKGAKALFLPMTLSLGMGTQPGGMPEWPAIKQFLEQKGVVVTTVMPACDEFLQPLVPPKELVTQAVSLASIKGDLAGALAKHGVQPLVTVKSTDGASLSDLRTYVHTVRADDKSRATIVSFLRPPPNSKQTIGADGVPRVESSSDAGKPMSCVVDCRGIPYAACYEQSRGRRITADSGSIPVLVPAAEGKLLTFLPYVVTGVRVDVMEADRALKVHWQISRDADPREKGIAFVPHVVRVEVVDAKTGEVDLDLGRNVTSGSDGQGEAVIPLSVSEAGRQWTVRVTDILTGLQGK